MGPRSNLSGRTISEIVAASTGYAGEVIEPTTTLSDLGVDSLESVELCMAMEKEFNLSISDERWEKVETVQDIIDLVSARIYEQSA